mgnify:CR=1 FL=1
MINKGKGWRLATVAAALMMAGSAWATEDSASFKNADIEEFINTVGKNLNKTIIIEPSVRGKINVRSYDLLNEDQYYQFFLSVLDVYGFAVVPMNNGVLKVVRSKDAKTSAIPVVDDSNPGVGDEMVTRVVPVRNVSVRELAPPAAPAQRQRRWRQRGALRALQRAAHHRPRGRGESSGRGGAPSRQGG